MVITHDEASAIARENVRLAVRIEELERALEPFAREAARLDRWPNAPSNSHRIYDGAVGEQMACTIGDFRRARAALAQTECKP